MHGDSPLSTGEFGVIKSSNSLGNQKEKTIISRIGQTPSHFISMEVPAEGPLAAEVKRYQEWVQEGAGDVIIGKAQKLSSLHVTLGVLLVLEDELEPVKKAIKKAFEKFKDWLLFEQGFLSPLSQNTNSLVWIY